MSSVNCVNAPASKSVTNASDPSHINNLVAAITVLTLDPAAAARYNPTNMSMNDLATVVNALTLDSAKTEPTSSLAEASPIHELARAIGALSTTDTPTSSKTSTPSARETTQKPARAERRFCPMTRPTPKRSHHP
ncbi:hypothetical protein DFQ27_008999 [Actinomortierella ambigua]|uniref:Uncharacterized protein n=1 Tax=Actinomortierella ambigua TaxID=1343610 RepID=A0A9P6UAY6_9FUNG|nr:hypothetical protein DFQ27_008999 [Actinomortierella ambigua]